MCFRDLKVCCCKLALLGLLDLAPVNPANFSTSKLMKFNQEKVNDIIHIVSTKHKVCIKLMLGHVWSMPHPLLFDPELRFIDVVCWNSKGKEFFFISCVHHI